MKSNIRPVRVLVPSLFEKDTRLVCRGVIDPHCLGNLLVDQSYQREVLSDKKRREIAQAVEAHARVPDIELGMRGDTLGNSHGDEGEKDAWVELLDPVYIMDGQQRTETVKAYLDRYPEEKYYLGAAITFNTDKEYERQQFKVLNMFRSRMSASLLLRNEKDHNDYLATLYGLSMSQHDNVLFHRIAWKQTMLRGELVTGLLLAKVMLMLHGHLAPISTTNIRDIPNSGMRCAKLIGLPLLRSNTTLFWNTVDSAFGFKAVAYAKMAYHLRSNFLMTLARLLSDHHQFWSSDDKRLIITPSECAKLRRFPIGDPTIQALAGSSGAAANQLYIHLLEHMNSGRRKENRLRRRENAQMSSPDIANDEDDDDDAVVA